MSMQHLGGEMDAIFKSGDNRTGQALETEKRRRELARRSTEREEEDVAI